MEEINQLSEFGKILVFFILGGIFVMIGYATSYFLALRKPNPEKLSTYECGEVPEGGARIQFNNRFYVIALVFLLFDVEIVFLFPWATIFGQQAIINVIPEWGWLAFVEMAIFVGILLMGLVYVWVKGDLEWIKPQQILPVSNTGVPMEMYDKLNDELYSVKTFSMENDKSNTTTEKETATTKKPVFKPRIIKKKD